MGKLMRKVLASVFAAVMLVGFALPASAQVTLEDVLRRVEALEKENATLKAEVASMKGKQSAQAVELSEVKTKAATLVAVPSSPTGNFLKTKPEVELYGFVKADLVMSNHDMGTGNAGVAQSSATRPSTAGSSDQEAQMSAQDTRLGLNFKAPDLDNGGKITGKFEMDFANTTASAGSYLPRLRLAYAQIEFDKWGINAGQNWDIFSPLNTSALNPGALFRQGNLGIRHAQVHVANKWGEVFGGKLTSKIGVLDSDDSIQEDSGSPVAVAYVGYEKNILGVKSTFGLGGLYGKLNVPGVGVNDVDIYATTAGMTLKFTDWLSFKTEGYIGAGLNKFQGGPAYTVDGYSGTALSGASTKAIPVKGGFMELTYLPMKKVETNIGVGIDDVKEDMAGYTATDKGQLWDTNMTYYSNIKYSLSKDLVVGLEFQSLQTEWLDGLKAHDQRIESSVIYKF